MMILKQKLFRKLGVLTMILLFIVGCGNSSETKGGKGATYVSPSVDYRGRYRKGHVRMPVSLKKDAYKSQARSRYYYHTRGKYRK
jgi:hypothetical protein